MYSLVYTFSKTLTFHLINKLTIENISCDLIYKYLINKLNKLICTYSCNKKLLSYDNIFFRKKKINNLSNNEKNFELITLVNPIVNNNLNYMLYKKINEKPYSKLKTLSLNFNKLSNDDVDIISKNKKTLIPKLKTLELSNNNIDDQGAIMLANNIDKLDELNVSYNNISLHGYIILFEKYINHDINKLNIENNIIYDEINNTINYIPEISETDFIDNNNINIENEAKKNDWILI